MTRPRWWPYAISVSGFIGSVCAVTLASILLWTQRNGREQAALWTRARYDAEAFARRLVTEEAARGTVLSTYCAREDLPWTNGPVFRCRVSVQVDGDDEVDVRNRVALVRCRPGNGCIYDEDAQRAFRACR